MRGLDPAEREGVHGDVLAAELLRECPREGQHRAARAGRHAETLLAHARRVADDADDAAALLGRQLRRGRVADVEDAIEVDVHLALPLFGLRLEKQLRLDVARVVDDDVEAAQLGDDPVDHPAHGGVVGHVGLIGHRAAAQLRDRRHEGIRVGLRVHVVDGDGRAFASQGQADLAADVPPAPGDQRDLTGEPEIHRFAPWAPSRSRKSRSGLTGSSATSIPSGDRASAIALAMAAGAPMVPPSPMPRNPPSVTGDGVSR